MKRTFEIDEEEIIALATEKLADEAVKHFGHNVDMARNYNLKDAILERVQEKAVNTLYAQLLETKYKEALEEITASQLASAILLKASKPDGYR